MIKNKKILVFIALFLIVIGSINTSFAGFLDMFNKDIDRINQYYITINPRKDASLDIRYDIQWEILSDNAEKLTEVFIGIPNSNLNQLKAITSNIASLKENNGVVKVTFREEYKGKQTLDFSFSLHQMNMYTLEDGNCNYSFTPGWFDEIEVKDARVLWNSKNALSADTGEINSDGYYVWSGKLKKGEKMTANVKYIENAFKYSTSTSTVTTSTDELDSSIGDALNTISSSMNIPYTNMDLSGFTTMDPNTALKNIYKIGGLGIACCLGGFVLSIVGGLGRGYSSHGGYGYYGGSRYGSYYSRDTHTGDVLGSVLDGLLGGGSGGGGGGHGCACACACAGGGRAGCSKKDFYGTNVRTKNIEKVLAAK